MSFYRLVAGLLLSAPLFGAELKGVVQDAQGATIPEANVTLWQMGKRVRELRTDESGVYAFTGLDAGVYDLEITRPGFAVYRSSGIHLASDERKNMDGVVLAVAVSLGPSFVISAPDPPPGFRPLNAWRGAVSGRVVSAVTSVGIPGARLRLICPDGQLCAVGIADEFGRFHFARLKAGNYSLQADGYLTKEKAIPIRAGF